MSNDAIGSYRRDVMKAVGAGTMLSLFGGTAAAQEDGDGPDDDGPGDDGPDDGPATGTVYTVRTLIRGPSTNPGRPVDFFFQPTGLHVEPGDVVRFVFATPDHNVVSMHPTFGMRRRVPLGVDAFSSPLLGWRPGSIPGDQIEPPAETGSENGDDDQDESGDDGDESGDDDGDESGAVPNTWLHAFETPGVYDMICSPHEGFGMAFRVVVGEETDREFETADPNALPEPRAGPVGLARVTLTDPALDPETIVEAGSVPWESLEANATVSADDDG